MAYNCFNSYFIFNKLGFLPLFWYFSRKWNTKSNISQYRVYFALLLIFSEFPDVIWELSRFRFSVCVSVCLSCHSSHLCLQSLCNFTLRVKVRVYTLPLITSLLANPMEPQLLLLQPNQPQLYCYSSTCTILCFFACKWN